MPVQMRLVSIGLPQQRLSNSKTLQCLQDNMAARIRTARSEAARMVEFDYGEAGSIRFQHPNHDGGRAAAAGTVDAGYIWLLQWWSTRMAGWRPRWRRLRRSCWQKSGGWHDAVQYPEGLCSRMKARRVGDMCFIAVKGCLIRYGMVRAPASETLFSALKGCYSQVEEQRARDGVVSALKGSSVSSSATVCLPGCAHVRASGAV